MPRTDELLALLLLTVTSVLPACSPVDAEPMDDASPASPEWSTAAPVPEPRTEVSVTTDGQRIFLIGGFTPDEAGGDPSAPRTMWVYDPESETWTDGGPIPAGINHAGFVHHGGRLYIVGGFRENSFEPVAAVRVYDIAAGSWSDGPPLPTPRGALAAVVLNGRIHAIGGNVSGPEAVHDHEGSGITSDNSVAIHEVLDLASGQWERLAPMPTARNHLGAAAIEGRIHVVGGRASGNFELTAHEVYDPGDDGWETAAPVPTGRSGIAVVESGGALYVFGGETFAGGGRTFDAAERFDPSTDAWEELTPMPTARHGLGAAPLGGWIHVISGGPQPGFSFGTYHERLGPIDPVTGPP